MNETTPPTNPTLAIGRQGNAVVVAVNGRPFLHFSAAEASFFAAHLIKHACSISSGAPMVTKAIDDVYGEVQPGPAIHSKPTVSMPPTPPPQSSS